MMKKSLSTLPAVFFTFALLFGMVLPVAAKNESVSTAARPFGGLDGEAFASEGGNWALVMSTVSPLASGGVLLTFDVTSGAPSVINTLAYASSGGAYPLNCGFNSNRGILVCRINSGIQKCAGHTAYFELGGQPFTITIPEKQCITTVIASPATIDDIAEFLISDLDLIAWTSGNECRRSIG